MSRALPASILAGSLIIAVGLYLGLRERQTGGTDAPRPASPDSPQIPASAPPLATTAAPDAGRARPDAGRARPEASAATGRVSGQQPTVQRDAAPMEAQLPPPPSASQATLPPGPPAVPDPVRDAVTRLAAEALAAAKPALVERCWAPLVAAAPEPSSATFDLDVTFDGRSGRLIASGISEVRGASRADVAQCLRGAPLDLRIEPQGLNVGVQVRLTLP